MLPDRLQTLLASYVGNELSPRQRDAVEAVLRKSPEARAFLQKLRADAQALRGLPRLELDADFSRRVMRTIADRNLRPSRRPAAGAAPLSVRPWFGVAVAAGVIAVVGLTTFGYVRFLGELQRPAATPNGIARPAAKVPAGTDVAESDPGQKIRLEPETDPASRPPETGLARRDDRNPAPAVETPGEAAPESPEPALGTRSRESERIEVYKPELSLILNVRDLGASSEVKRVRDALDTDTAFRVEFLTSEKSHSLERLQYALRHAGLRLLVDQTAQLRAKRGLATNYLVVTEELTADDLLAVMKKLGTDSAPTDARSRFDRAVLSRVAATDRQEVTLLFGVDPLQPLSKQRLPFGVDLRKPLSEGTADQVLQHLTGGPGHQSQDRLAVALAAGPVRTIGVVSKEVRSFLMARKDRRPGTLQLILVLREVNG